MKLRFLLLFFLISLKVLAQDDKNCYGFSIDNIIENRYVILSNSCYDKYIYDLIKNKTIATFKGTVSVTMNKKILVTDICPSKLDRLCLCSIDMKTGKIISSYTTPNNSLNNLLGDSLKKFYKSSSFYSFDNNKFLLPLKKRYFADNEYKQLTKLLTISCNKITEIRNVDSSIVWDIATNSILSKESYDFISQFNTKLKKATETFYIYPESHTQEGGDAPHNNDYRIPEKEQIRYNYPYLIDTLSNDGFGVFNLKKQLYFNTHILTNYKLKSANISPKQTFYYATFNKINDEKYYHYIFNIANNNYVNLSNYDTSKCSKNDIHRVSFSANDSFFATINTCEKAIIYKMGNVLKQYCINDANELIARIEFSPKSNYFITYSVYENDTTSYYKSFDIYDSAGQYYASSTKYSMTRLNKPLYFVKVWDCKTMKPILDFRTSSIKFGFSEDDNYLALKNENIMVKTFFGYPRDNYSFYKDTASNPYLSIIDLNSKKEIKKLKLFDKYDIRLEYMWNRQEKPYFIFSADNKKIITNQNEDYPQRSSVYFYDIYDIANGSSLLKKINGEKE